MQNDYRLAFLIFSRGLIEQLDGSNKFGRFLQGIQQKKIGILPLKSKEKHREKPLID